MELINGVQIGADNIGWCMAAGGKGVGDRCDQLWSGILLAEAVIRWSVHIHHCLYIPIRISWSKAVLAPDKHRTGKIIASKCLTRSICFFSQKLK